MSKRIVDVPTGRRGDDGILQLKQFTPGTITLTIERTGERIPTLILTRAQATALRDALNGLIPDLEEGASQEEETYVEGVDRRLHAA